MSGDKGKTLGVPELRSEYRLSRDLAVIVARVTPENREVYDAVIGKLEGNHFYDGEADRAIKYLRTLRK